MSGSNIEELIRWREWFEADRAARGIPPEGLGNPNAIARTKPTPKPKPKPKPKAKPMRPKYVKNYPRTRISRTPAGTWVIDYLASADAAPDRQRPSFVGLKFAYRAAARLTVDGPPRKRAPNGQHGEAGSCKPCKTPMRWTGQKIKDFPGTRIRHREGLCSKCYLRTRKAA